MASFWLVNALYQLLVPMPLPALLWPLHAVLLGFAVVAMLAYVSAALAARSG